MILPSDRDIALEAAVVGKTTAHVAIDATGIGRDTLIGVSDGEFTGVDVAFGKLESDQDRLHHI